MKAFTRLNLLLFFSVLLMNPVKAQTPDYQKFGIDVQQGIPKGLNIGDKAPPFTAKDDKGKDVSLDDLLQKGSVILFFYRGEWCPVCQRYLKRYRDSLDMVIAKGVNVTAVTPETIDNVEKTRNKTGYRFTVISDPDRKIMDDYKVLFHVTENYQHRINVALGQDIAEVNGNTDAWLPVPATYIINKKGIITARYFNPDYRDRASVQWMLSHLPKK